MLLKGCRGSQKNVSIRGQLQGVTQAVGNFQEVSKHNVPGDVWHFTYKNQSSYLSPTIIRKIECYYLGETKTKELFGEENERLPEARTTKRHWVRCSEPVSGSVVHGVQGVRELWSQAYLHQSGAVRLQAGHCSSLGISFHICKMGIIPHSIAVMMKGEKHVGVSGVHEARHSAGLRE